MATSDAISFGERYRQPEPERFLPPQPERFDAVAADQADQARAREWRMRSLSARRQALARRSTLSQARERVQQTQALIKQARNFKTVLTLAGGLTSLTVLGVIWTLFQWNVQMIWTIFSLPGNQFIGMPMWMVPVVMLFDFIVFVLFVILMAVAYAYTHPFDVAINFPALAWEMLGIIF